MSVLDRLIDAGIGTISRCITSSMRRKGGILHHPEFNQAMAESGQNLAGKPLNEEDAMLLAVDVLVRYTLIGSGGVGFIYFIMKSHFDYLEEGKLEMERRRVRSIQKAEQELGQIMQQYQISEPSIMGGRSTTLLSGDVSYSQDHEEVEALRKEVEKLKEERKEDRANFNKLQSLVEKFMSGRPFGPSNGEHGKDNE